MSFIDEVDAQIGKKIEDEKAAADLIALAERILAVI